MNSLNQPININITPATFFKAILVVLFFWFLFLIKGLVLVLLTSIVIASAIEPGTRWFVGKKIPRAIAVLLIYVIVILIFSGIFYFFVPPLIQDMNNIVFTLPDYIDSLFDSENRFGAVGNFPVVENWIEELSTGESSLIQIISGGVFGATAGFIGTLSAIFGGVLSFVLILVLSFYLAVQDDGVASFLKIVVPIKHEKYAIDLWKRSQRKIGLWMQGQLMLIVMIGVLTYLGLSILGVENALFLALIAAIFELIPIFGPILAAIPVIGFGLAQGGLTLGLLVVGLYIIIQQFESQLIHPLVVKKIVGIPALVAILAIIVGAQVAGFLGIILSVPIAAAIMEYVSDVEKRKHASLVEEKELKEEKKN